LVLLGVSVLVAVLVDDGVSVFDLVRVSEGVNETAGRGVAVRDTYTLVLDNPAMITLPSFVPMTEF
jgi:hypothetical protein